MQSKRSRYAIVGTGERSGVFIDAMDDAYDHRAELVGLCDSCQTRMDWHNNRRSAAVPTFADTQFDDLIYQTRPDVVIVTTIDSLHHRYIIRALELGCDVFTEKPMTIDSDKLNGILEAVKRTGNRVQVALNYRFDPLTQQIGAIIRSGAIGRARMVQLDWMLDTSHGADYFRRWHRDKNQSGGLIVHKSSHHFDLVNYWLGSVPMEVNAMGGLLFYGETNQKHWDQDRFEIDLADNGLFEGLYLNAEQESGYVRDHNVFGGGISSEDSVNVTTKYRNGAMLCYTLMAYAPQEGFRLVVSGDQARLEVEFCGRLGSSAVQCAGGASSTQPKISVTPLFGKPQLISPSPECGKQTSDQGLLKQLFDPDGQHPAIANEVDGALAAVVGIAANQSMHSRQTISIEDLMSIPSHAPCDSKALTNMPVLPN